MRVGLLTPIELITNWKKSNLINEHALNREPVLLNPENTGKKMTVNVFSI